MDVESFCQWLNNNSRELFLLEDIQRGGRFCKKEKIKLIFRR